MEFLWCDCVIGLFVFVSSPYLLVFGDDRVRGTREQMMLQVDLVRHRCWSLGKRTKSQL